MAAASENLNQKTDDAAATPTPEEPVIPDAVPSEKPIYIPKAKLLDQMREVMRLRHYSIRTEQAYCDWVRRYLRFHDMKSREELAPAEAKVERFLTDLAVNGNVSATPSCRPWAWSTTMMVECFR